MNSPVPYAQGGAFPTNHSYANLPKRAWPKLEVGTFPGAVLVDLAEI